MKASPEFFRHVRVQYVVFSVLAVLFLISIFTFGENISLQYGGCISGQGVSGQGSVGYYMELEAPHPLAGYKFPCAVQQLGSIIMYPTYPTSYFFSQGIIKNEPTYLPDALANSCLERWGAQAFTNLYDLQEYYFYEVPAYFVNDASYQTYKNVPANEQNAPMTFACRLKCQGTVAPIRQPNENEATTEFVTPSYVKKIAEATPQAKLFVGICALVCISSSVYAIVCILSALWDKQRPLNTILLIVLLVLDGSIVILGMAHNAIPIIHTINVCNTNGVAFLDQQMFGPVSLVGISFVTLRIAFFITSYWDFDAAHRKTSTRYPM